MRSLRLLLMLLITVAVVFGCGSDDVPVAIENREAFDAAVARHLRGNSMDMKIAEYRSFELAEDGASATAEIALEHADDLYGLKVTYRFVFARGANDRWRVESSVKVD
jgi:hypothetical protein